MRALHGGQQDPNRAARLTTRGRLDTLTIPAIYLYGVDDVLLPVQQGYLQEKALPNIQFFFRPSAGIKARPTSPTCSIMFLPSSSPPAK